MKKLFKADCPKLPTRANDHAAGIDFYALHPGSLLPGEHTVIRTGIAVEIPPGHFGFTRLRSGVAANWGLVIASSSTIDEDYRGEVMLPVYRLSRYARGLAPDPFEWEAGARLFQMIVLPYPRVTVEEVGELSPTARGTGGFGSTGV